MPNPSRRTLAVLQHLLDAEDGSTVLAIAETLSMAPLTVTRQVAHFVNRGWTVRDGEQVTLTEAGRVEGAALVAESAEAAAHRWKAPAFVDDDLDATPLADLDVTDPELADRVRVRMGWTVRHTPS